MTTCNALQFRKLVDHPRLQIVLGQFGRTPRQCRVNADLFRDAFGQRGNALYLVGHAAQLGLIGYGRESCTHRFQALLQVFIEEKPCIGETGANHPLVTLANLVRVLRLDIRNTDEVLAQLAVTVQHREEFLVGFHGGDQRFLRHRQEVVLERTGHRNRPFVEAVHLLQVVGFDAGRAIGSVCGGFDFRHDARAALVRIDQDMCTAHCIDIVAGGLDPHGLVVMEAMPATVAARVDAECVERDHVIAQQGHQPVQRTREAVIVIPPAHRLGNRHAGHCFVQHGLQQVGGLRARRHRTMHEALALCVAGFFQRVPCNAGLCSEAFQRARRRAVGIECDVEIGAEHFTALFGLFSSYARQQHRKTARRIQRFRIATLNGNATFFQRSDHAVEKGLRQAGQRLDRQFFGAEFNQERKHIHAVASGFTPRFLSPGNPSFSRCAKYASATACDNLRTRRM